jgi:zinc transporter 2
MPPSRGGRGRPSPSADAEAPLLPSSDSACVLADAAATDAAGPAAFSLQRRLVAGLAIASLFCVGEAVGGWFSNSLAIATDAAHLLSDVFGLGVALLAARAAAVAPGGRRSYGLHRAQVLAALASTAATWGVTGALLVEAVKRVAAPPAVDGRSMFVLAVVGVAVNLLLLAVLGEAHGGGHGGHDHPGHAHGGGGGDGGGGGHAGHSHDGGDHHHHHPAASSINARAAWLHVVGDLVQSLGVAVAGAAVWLGGPRWTVADPLCTFLFAGLVVATTVGLARDVWSILMQHAPAGLAPSTLREALAAVPGVAAVGDVHVWSLTPAIPVATAHVAPAAGADAGAVLAGATAVLEGLGVRHSTVQVGGAEFETR